MVIPEKTAPREADNMKKTLYGLICLIILLLTGCNKSASPIVSKPQLPKDIRAISAEWAEDRLFYLTDQGIYAFFPSDGSTVTLMSDDISKRDISWADFQLSPDKSKFIFLAGGSYDNTLEIRDATKDASIMLLDTQKYRQGVGQHSPYIYEAGWVDNDNIYLSTQFRLYIVNISSGKEVQITEECSPVTTTVSHNVVAPYLSWASNVTKINDKLYYNSVRNPENRSPAIYYEEKTGESELMKNAELLIPVDNESFVFKGMSKPEHWDIFLYDINTGRSSLISDEYLESDGIYKTNNKNLCFMTGDITGGVYQGAIYNPDTLQIVTYDMYNEEIDFPKNDTEATQFSHFMGAFEKNDVCVFLFSVANSSKTEGYIDKYFAYNTKTQKLTELSDYIDIKYVYMRINPTGEYILVTKSDKLDDDDFLFDIIKTDELL